MNRHIVLVLCCLSLESVQAGGVARLTIEPGVTLITKHNAAPVTKAPAPLTRKKHHSSVIFQGLAQSCQQLGTVVAANNKKEKQQGVINLLGTMFNVAAQLAAPTTPQPNTQTATDQATQQTQQPQSTQVAPALTKLTKALLEEFETLLVKSDITLLPILATFKSLKTTEEQEAFIQGVLSLPTGAKDYLNELFTALQAYFQINVSEILDYVKESLFTALDQTDAQPTQPVEAQQEQKVHAS